MPMQIAQAPMGSHQASAAADNARLSLTTAAALAFQETRQIPGIDDSPVSISTDSPASAAFQGMILMGGNYKERSHTNLICRCIKEHCGSQKGSKLPWHNCYSNFCDMQVTAQETWVCRSSMMQQSKIKEILGKGKGKSHQAMRILPISL